MKIFLEQLEAIEDYRQISKVKHKISDIIGTVLFAMLGNANEWTEIEIFATENEELLREYFTLENGIPSHDTIQRVMSMIKPEILQKLQLSWNEIASSNEGEKLKKILNIDGKTMRGSANKNQQAYHVVSAWSKEDGVCFGQTVVKEKANEIVAIPELLETIDIKNTVITIDAMGTQTKIAEQIKKQKGDYVLAVKGNQGTLHKELIEYFEDKEFLEEIKKEKGYKKTIEKNHGRIEKREYYQTENIGWINEKSKWKGLKSIGIVKSIVEKEAGIVEEIRYYISSLNKDIELFEKSTRGHWDIEIMHWHLDVTFKEDANKTLDKTANLNLNILRKFALSILKLLDVGKKSSLKAKRFRISCKPEKYIRKIMEL